MDGAGADHNLVLHREGLQPDERPPPWGAVWQGLRGVWRLIDKLVAVSAGGWSLEPQITCTGAATRVAEMIRDMASGGRLQLRHSALRDCLAEAGGLRVQIYSE